jgi:hypothetical protein
VSDPRRWGLPHEIPQAATWASTDLGDMWGYRGVALGPPLTVVGGGGVNAGFAFQGAPEMTIAWTCNSIDVVRCLYLVAAALLENV